MTYRSVTNIPDFDNRTARIEGEARTLIQRTLAKTCRCTPWCYRLLMTPAQFRGHLVGDLHIRRRLLDVGYSRSSGSVSRLLSGDDPVATSWGLQCCIAWITYERVMVQ
jgi:hypothetical protein